MANHVAALSRSCFFHLRRLRAIKQSVTSDATRTLVHAFVSSRLDSCNSLLAGVSSQLLQRLQVHGPECCRSSCHSSQKIIAYDACFTRSSLAVGSKRTMFKTAVLIYKAPPYLQTYCDWEPTSTLTSWRLCFGHLLWRFAIPQQSTAPQSGHDLLTQVRSMCS